jgi:hypothetical protein
VSEALALKLTVPPGHMLTVGPGEPAVMVTPFAVAFRAMAV